MRGGRAGGGHSSPDNTHSSQHTRDELGLGAVVVVMAAHGGGGEGG